MGLKVYKFGGALLNKIDGFKQLSLILSNDINRSSNSETNNSIIIVVSALQKTTSKLEHVASLAELYGEEHTKSFLDEIFDYHYNIADTLIEKPENKVKIKNIIDKYKLQISNILRGISITKELTPRTKDLVLSYGELLASNIVAVFLSETNPSVVLFNITDVLVTDSNYGAAEPNIPITQEKIEKLLLPLVHSNKLIVTQGFIASSLSNEITTMGYESSNLTATILAGLTKADEFTIWSDTEGIRQFDPKITVTTPPKLVKRISYDFAEYLANNGLKLIHPPMIKYLKMFDIEVVYKSGFKPDGEFSTIAAKGDNVNYRFLIFNDIRLYRKRIDNNNNNSFDFSLTYSFKGNNEMKCISPANNLYIASQNFLQSENETVLYGFERVENVVAVTFIYLDESEAIQFFAKNYNTNDEVFEIFINNLKKTAKILYATNNNTFINNAVRFFTDND